MHEVTIEGVNGVFDAERRTERVGERSELSGGTASCVVVAYAICESHVPSFQLAFGDNTLQVVLSARRIARFTYVGVHFCQVNVPVFMKNTVN